MVEHPLAVPRLTPATRRRVRASAHTIANTQTDHRARPPAADRAALSAGARPSAG